MNSFANVPADVVANMPELIIERVNRISNRLVARGDGPLVVDSVERVPIPGGARWSAHLRGAPAPGT